MVGKEKTENYLRTILKIQKRYGSVRSSDISRELDVSKPTVSIAVHELEKSGYVTCDNDSGVILTEKGKKLAQDITERYQFFRLVLRYLGVEEKTAEIDACKMEHYMCDESYQAFYRFFWGFLSREASQVQFDNGIENYFFY